MQIKSNWQKDSDEVVLRHKRNVINVRDASTSKSIDVSEFIRQGDKIHVRHRNQYHRSNTESNNA
jgi:hypothetical protein